MDSLFLKNCFGEKTDKKPVWMMRQAGRYLPEYLEVRNRFFDFLSFVKDFRAAAEVTVQPVRRFHLDAAILFSDILVTLPLLGLDVQFIPGVGPKITSPIRDEEAVRALRDDSPETLDFTREAIFKTLDLLRGEVPLLGFVGGPLTLASYAIEGGTSKNLQETKKFFWRYPKAYHELLSKIANLSGEYLNLQRKWGCRALVVMDSWAGLLSEEDYREMAYPYVKRVLEMAASKETPSIHYANGASHLIGEMVKLPAHVLGLDWRSSLIHTFEKFPDKIFQGNLDPALLFSTPAIIRKRTREICSLTKNRAHIMNLGHGVLPGTPIENVRAFVEAVKEF